MQILETVKITTKGTILDLGADPRENNITNFLNKNSNIIYADKFKKNNTLFIDLEINNKLENKFDNIFAMNLLEHIKNYRNVIQLSYNSLNKNGLFFGSTPFMFGVHPAPNDYYRFTYQLLKEDLEEVGFADIKIKALSYGFFTNIYSLICNFTKKIPLLNIFIITICIFLDLIFFKINKNYKQNHPLGYYFFASKK
jgi:hypothetical protein